MNFPKAILKIDPVASPLEQKRINLLTFFSFLGISVAILYYILSTLIAVNYTKIFFAILLGGNFIAFLLNRYGYYIFARYIFLIGLVCTVLIGSIETDFIEKSHYYYILINIGGFLLFETKNRWMAFSITIICIFGYTITLYTCAAHSDTHVNVSEFLHFFGGIILSSYLLYILTQRVSNTEKKLLENTQHLNAQHRALSKAHEELDRFIYSASHDLRAPLTSILGLTNIARITDDAREIKECLQMITTRVQKLDSFIKDMIDFSRNARTKIESQEVYIHETVSKLLDNLKTVYPGASSIDFRIEISENQCWLTDKIRIKVILNNLLSNCIRFYDTSKLENYVRIKSFQTKEHNVIIIEDNGIGIEKQHIPNIFGMFYRASNQSKGSGLGLYIVKETVTTLGGTISMESEAGVGTEMTIKLPR
jgi:signal transduction histidine kinase